MLCYVCYWNAFAAIYKQFWYKFLILDIYHLDTIYVSKEEDLWLFFEAKRGPLAKRLRDT
jgi:hypothetical protein